MSDPSISAVDRYERKRIQVLDTEIAYIDVGEGEPIVFLHGNPTSSYLWRNIIPHVEPLGRCLAPDLVGMGASGRIPGESLYTYEDHYKYLDAWFDAVGLTENITLVIHDWGSGLGFNYAYQHRADGRVKAIVYMEAIVCPIESWEDWPEAARGIFTAMRLPEKGEDLVLNRNFFVERILPSSVMRPLTEEEMDVYRAPFREAGESRRPTLTWPRMIPIEGEPESVTKIAAAYAQWLSENDSLPKLFINAEPGIILIGRQREFCRSWPNQTEVTVKGLHFLQEDSPHEIGAAIAHFLQGLDK